MSRVARAARVASRQRVETITADKTIQSAETGELYLINYDTGATITVTLPAMQDGAYFKFLFQAEMDTASAKVKITSSEAVDGDFLGGIFEQVTGGSNANSAFVTSAPATNHQVTLSHEIQPGTWIECVCDGTNWILSGCANVSAVGKVVFGS